MNGLWSELGESGDALSARLSNNVAPALARIRWAPTRTPTERRPFADDSPRPRAGNLRPRDMPIARTRRVAIRCHVQSSNLQRRGALRRAAGVGAMKSKALWLLMALLSPVLVGCVTQSTGAHDGAMTVTVENDTFTGSDNNYTNGIGGTWNSNEINAYDEYASLASGLTSGVLAVRVR